jgi:hypothetical protein
VHGLCHRYHRLINHFQMLPMLLLGDEAQVEAPFGPLVDSANLDASSVHGMRRAYHRLEKSFWMHLMELLGVVGHVKSCFSTFGDSVSVGAR